MERDDAVSLLAAVLAHAPGPVAVLDRDLRFVAVSASWEEHHGLPAAQVVGRPHGEVLPELPECWRALMERVAAEGTVASGTDPIPFRAGRLDWVRWSISAWRRRDGEIGGVLVVHELLTEHRRELERVDRLVAMLSHELRTPLTNILGALRLLGRGLGSGAEALRAELLDVADRNAARMLAVIDDLLELQRVRLGELEHDPRPVLLSDVVREAVRRAEPLADASGVRLDNGVHGASGAIIGDPGRLGGVLDRVLQNAIRWSPPRGAVSVRLDGLGDRHRLLVDDEGPGVPEEQRLAVFEPFVQGSTGDARTHDGTGLGLALCRAVIERHGGQIGLDAAPGGGARLWLELPAYR